MSDLTTPSAASAGLASTGLGQLRVLKHAICRMSLAMGTASPNEVSANFIDALKTMGPPHITRLVVPWVMLVVAGSQYPSLTKWYAAAKAYLRGCFHASVAIPSDHQLYQQVLDWVYHRGLQSKARTQVLTKSTSKMKYQYGGVTYSGRPPSSMRGVPVLDDRSGSRRQLSYLHDNGKYSFRFGGHTLVMERTIQQTDKNLSLDRPESKAKQVINISCYSLWGGVQPIKDFLERVAADDLVGREKWIIIFRALANGSWDMGVSRAARALEDVALQPGVKEELVKDMEEYLHPNTENVLNVHIITLSSNHLNDQKLEALFDMLPERCIVLLEDIDSAGIKREVMTASRNRRAVRDTYGLQGMEDAQGVTLSALLNVLDGVRAAEGRIVIMTTNKKETLDPALIRRGRIDKQVYFGLASRQTAIKLFRQIFCKRGDELLDNEAPRADWLIDDLSRSFAAQVAENTFTPVEVQGFLLDRHKDPVKAVREAATYFNKLAMDKAKNTAGSDRAPTAMPDVAEGYVSEDVTNRTASDDSISDTLVTAAEEQHAGSEVASELGAGATQASDPWNRNSCVGGVQ